MGVPIPPVAPPLQADAGGPCTICWGSGKPFGDVDTPDYVQVVVSGINKGPLWIPAYGEPYNGTYLLQQNGILYCSWKYQVTPLLILVDWRVGLERARMLLLGGLVVFDSFAIDPCQTFILNRATQYFVGGSMQLTIPVVP